MHTTDVDLRFQDLDAAGHLNNAVYVTVIEEARVAYLEDVLDLSLREMTIVVAALSVEFQAPVTDADVLTVETTVTSVGESSFEMAYELLHHDTVVATAETVQVTIDPGTRDPVPIPEAWRTGIRAHEDRDT
ncbi:MAG: acyl-CoA thioesterase [Halobacteriaceae archaeon]